MRIPIYQRQIVREEAPSVAPTPVFEAERAGLSTNQNIFNQRSNLKRIEVNADIRDKSYDIQKRSIQQQRDYLHASTTLQYAQLGLKALEMGVNIYQASANAQTATAIETYQQEAVLRNAELERRNYTFGDIPGIESQYGEFIADDFTWQENTREKVLEGITNSTARKNVEAFISRENAGRVQAQRFKFEDARREQMGQDYLENVNGAAARSDYRAVDAYLRIAVEDGVFSPERADEIDGLAEKTIINNQLSRGVTSIFENGGDTLDAREFIMSYDPQVSGRQNYVLTTEDRETFYSAIAKDKKINDELIKERNVKYFNSEANQLAEMLLNGSLTLERIQSSGLPESKLDGYESQHSQKYWVEALAKQPKPDTDPGALNDLLKLINNPEATYFEKWSGITKALIEDETVSRTESSYLYGLLEDAPEGVAVQNGIKLIEDMSLANGGILGDEASNMAMKSFLDTLKRENYPTREISELANKCILEAARTEGTGRDVMKYLDLENEGTGFFNKRNTDVYLAENEPQTENQPLWQRAIAAGKQQKQAAFDQAFREEFLSEYNRLPTEQEIVDYKIAGLELDAFDDGHEDLRDYGVEDSFKLVQDDFGKNLVKGIFGRFDIEPDSESIFRRIDRNRTAWMIKDVHGDFYEYDGENVKVWDGEVEKWIFL